MAKTIEDLFVYLRIATDILIILLFLISFKKVNKEKGFKVICFFSLFDLLIILTLSNFKFNHKTEILILTFYTIVEYVLFAFFIFLHIQNSSFKKLMLISSSIFI